MNYKKYFEKNGYVYGVSYKVGSLNYALKFTDLSKAEEWLNTEEYDFYERELCSRSRAKNLAGTRAVMWAEHIAQGRR